MNLGRTAEDARCHSTLRPSGSLIGPGEPPYIARTRRSRTDASPAVEKPCWTCWRRSAGNDGRVFSVRIIERILDETNE
jgi:hypothetical protein